jgi:hypothetical protein
MRLKAIASPERYAQELATALNPAPERAHRPAGPRYGSVLDAVRLRRRVSFGWRWKAPMSWKTGRPPGLSHLLSQQEVPGSVAGPRGFPTAGWRGHASQAAARRSSVPARADVGRRSVAWPFAGNGDAAAQREPWPVVGPLATDVGICGQIGRNALVIQGDLATDREAGIVRNPCLDALMRGCCPVPW